MLRRIGILASFALGLIFISALICLIIQRIWPLVDIKVVSLISNNWLITILKIHANIVPYGQDLLFGIDLYDIIILALFILVCFSLFKISNYQNKIWFIISISLLILGIIIFIVTKLAGRSAFMVSGIIISSLMFTRGFRNIKAGFIGSIANIHLLVGDFTVGSHLRIISLLFVIGYILLITWFFLISNIIIKTEKISRTIDSTFISSS